MDKASDFGSEDWEFESRRGQFSFCFSLLFLFLTGVGCGSLFVFCVFF